MVEFTQVSHTVPYILSQCIGIAVYPEFGRISSEETRDTGWTALYEYDIVFIIYTSLRSD
jgi:hypothetical protein